MSTLEPHYARTPAHNLPAIERRPIHVVLDNIRSAFNVGSIFRTADAAAVAHIHLCGMTAYPPNKKLEKTALGAMEYVPWTYHRNTESAIDRLTSNGFTCVAIEAVDEAKTHFDFSWPNPVAILFGNEVTGVSPDIQARCAATVRIPMFGFKNTLNVATAFGIVLYEVVRQLDRHARREWPDSE